MANKEKRVNVGFHPEQVKIMDDLIARGTFQTYSAIVRYYMSKELDRLDKTKNV